MDPTQEMVNAIKANEIEKVRELVDADSSLATTKTALGISPILLAAYYGRAEIARMLRERSGGQMDIFEAAATGANDRIEQILNEDPSLVNAFAPDGFQPLGLASFFGHLDVVECLLARRAEVNTASRNAQRVMPLHSAVASQQLDIAAALLSKGADVNAKQQDGFTPLHEAAQNGQVEMVKLLLQYGADVNATKDDGKTALDLAREHGHKEVVELLQQHGAKEG